MFSKIPNLIQIFTLFLISLKCGNTYTTTLNLPFHIDSDISRTTRWSKLELLNCQNYHVIYIYASSEISDTLTELFNGLSIL